MFPILNHPPSTLPVPSLWFIPVHQPQASSIMHRTWTGDSFHIWYYRCFNSTLPNHPKPWSKSIQTKKQRWVGVSTYTNVTTINTTAVIMLCFLRKAKWTLYQLSQVTLSKMQNQVDSKIKKRDKKQKTVTLTVSRQSPKKTSIPSLKHHNSMATPMLHSIFQTEHIEYSI